MALKFEAEVQQLDQLTYVKVSGQIDEDNDLAALAPRIRGQAVLIDLSTVRDINNCGVRDWVKWREELQARGIAVVLVECSSAVVAKLNSVSNFNDGGYIKSFYLPYYCVACETEKALLVDMDEFRGEGPIKAPTCRCDSCDAIMAFDDLEESYFAFVRTARALLPPEPLQQLIDKLAPAAGERKILSSMPGRSSFSGIPSTASPASFGTTGAGSVASGLSVSQLRRLRDKTGLRTRRQQKAAQASRGRPRLLWLLIGALATVLLATAAAMVLTFR